MKLLCDDHWNAVRNAVQAEDMALPKWSETTRRYVEAALLPRMAKEVTTELTFNPYAMVYFSFLDEITRLVGFSVVMSDECPACFTDASHKAECMDAVCEFAIDNYLPEIAKMVKSVFVQMYPEAAS